MISIYLERYERAIEGTLTGVDNLLNQYLDYRSQRQTLQKNRSNSTYHLNQLERSCLNYIRDINKLIHSEKNYLRNIRSELFGKKDSAGIQDVNLECRIEGNYDDNKSNTKISSHYTYSSIFGQIFRITKLEARFLAHRCVIKKYSIKENIRKQKVVRALIEFAAYKP